MKLYSCRNSPARGIYWQAERTVTDATAQAWLKVFRNDEPTVLFLVANKKPR